MSKLEAPIVTMSSLKGGTGKSTISFNFASYLARKHQKVLVIDLDYQQNMTSNFSHVLSPQQIKECSIMRAFKHDAVDPRKPFDFKPAHTDSGIDLISSDPDLDNVDQIMAKKSNFSSYVLMHLIFSKKLRNKYNWIIIDTHNNFKTLTKNAFIISDIILSPVTESRYSLTAVGDMVRRLKELKSNYYDVKAGQSEITAKLFFIGNMISQTSNLAKQFSDLVKENPDFIAGFHNRALFQKATTDYKSVYSYVADHGSYGDRKIVNNEITPEFTKVENSIKSSLKNN